MCKYNYYVFYILFFCFYGLGCNNEFTPRPKAYFKIDFPKKNYQWFNQQKYPFEFLYPTYSSVEKDSLIWGKPTENPYWLNIHFKQFNATIYLTYKSLAKHKLEYLIYDCFKISNKQMYKADGLQDSMALSKNKYQIVFFNVSGDAATNYQFYITDSKKHFLRGALYLAATPNIDSTGIINDFIKKDMLKMVDEMKFK